jgi:hypothetical protein
MLPPPPLAGVREREAPQLNYLEKRTEWQAYIDKNVNKRQDWAGVCCRGAGQPPNFRDDGPVLPEEEGSRHQLQILPSEQ